tara:strand:+ start:5041 stop:6435 length:1395 start_codon:yes stop_codon:yes gene_type:complete
MEYKTPSASGKMDMKSLKTVNKLQYQLPSNLNVVERRQNKVSFADQNTYSSASGNEVVIRLTASTDYVYGKNSYLVFDIAGVAANGDLGFSKHTAMSLFSRVLFEDRSGAELERNDKLNTYCAQVKPWHFSAQYKDTGCAMAGQWEGGALVGVDSTGVPVDPPLLMKNGSIADYDIKASPLTVCIPLSHFLGVFDRETLIPSMLVSGSLIRLQLETPSVALQKLSATGGAVVSTGYSITNPRVILDSMALAPVIQKNLMEASQASGGLDFTYETAYYQGGNPGTSTNFNLQINKAVARCQRLYWSSHATATPVQTDKDSLGTAKANVNQLDYRLGDLYFPQRVITCSGTTQKTGAELYQNSMQSVGRMKTTMDPPSITKNEFLASGIALNATAGTNDNSGRCVHVQSFEQSSALEYSGLAINNSRTLEARISFVTPVATAQAIDAWITYVKLAKVNQIRAIIKE